MLVLLGAAALLHASRYGLHFTDAGLVALRRASELLSTWILGDSGLLWVAALACFELGGVTGVDAARFLGGVGLVLCVAAVSRKQAWAAGWIVLSGAMGAAAMSGLPLTLLAAVAAAAAVELREGKGWWLGLLLSLLRLDGFVLVLGLAVGAGRKGTQFLAAGTVAFLSHLALALYSFSTPAPTLDGLKAGAVGLLIGALWQLPLLVLAGIAVGRGARPSPALLGAGAWMVWMLVSGQGQAAGFAAWVPAIPLLVLVAEELPWKLHLLALGLLPSLFAGPMLAVVQPSWPLQTRPVAEALQRGFGEDVPSLGSATPGALPYFTQFPTRPLDDPEPPELVAFCTGLGALEPCTPEGEALVGGDAWKAYRPFLIEADGEQARYWLRVDDRFGPQLRGQGLEVPALMLSSDAHPVRAGRDGFYLDLAAGDTVTIELDLPRGRWRLATQGFRGPQLIHNGGRLKLTATADDDRVVSGITWIPEPR